MWTLNEVMQSSLYVKRRKWINRLIKGVIYNIQLNFLSFPSGTLCVHWAAQWNVHNDMQTYFTYRFHIDVNGWNTQLPDRISRNCIQVVTIDRMTQSLPAMLTWNQWDNDLYIMWAETWGIISIWHVNIQPEEICTGK